MMTFPVVPGVETNLFLLAFLGMAVGVLSGFVGVGGGFFVTPALIILGFPARLAVGTSLVWATGNSVFGAIRHRQMGNVDARLGLVMVFPTTLGVEGGVRALDWATRRGLDETVVLGVSVCVLLSVGGYTFMENGRTRLRMSTASAAVLLPMNAAWHQPHWLQKVGVYPEIYFIMSGTTISLWVILAIGLSTGVLAGFMGVGGGFIIVPAMVYFAGGTVDSSRGNKPVPDRFFCCLRCRQVRHAWRCSHTCSNCHAAVFVDWPATRGVGDQIRQEYLYWIRPAFLGSSMKLLGALMEGNPWVEKGTVIVTFGGLGSISAVVLGLLLAGVRRKSGKQLPRWVEAFVRE